MGFEDALRHTLQFFEGGYVNDPDDAGGETYKGVTRRSHPNWPGWALVDEAKKGAGGKAAVINGRLKGDQRMEMLVEDLYRKGYWDPLGELPERVKMKTFDIAVNAGKDTAERLLQTALNALGAGLKVDGIIGPATRGALGGFPQEDVLDALCRAQEGHYRTLVKKKPVYLKFLKGWLKRAAWKPA